MFFMQVISYIWRLIVLNQDRFERVSYFIDNILSRRKTKVTFYCTAVLWLAVVTQIFVNHTFSKEVEITDAFVSSDVKDCTSSIEIIGEYIDGALSEAEKEIIILKVAKAIGLVVDGDITKIQDASRIEFVYEKKASQASTCIKMISLEENVDEDVISLSHYLFVRIEVNDSIGSIDLLKDKLRDSLKKLRFDDIQTTLTCTGTYDGKLALEEKDLIVTEMLQDLKGSVAMRNVDEQMFTVYAYTGMVKEYVKTSGVRINVQIAISYDEENDKTRIYLATPLLTASW